MIAKSASKSIYVVKCGICRVEIVDRAQIYQAGINLGVICSACYQSFSTEDIEMMANMFIAYGGYFGMLKDSSFSFLKTLENLLKKGLKKKEVITSEQINVRLMHKALLHGISPQQYVQNLTLLFDE
ncbi:MAG: hypothetical protein ACW98X_07365 [Promethearchaeota archaeon]|jgi:hypothetical protein